MENQLNEDWLEKALRAERNIVPDDGFSHRVVAALPVAAERPWIYNAIIFGATIVSSLIALFFLPAGHWLVTAFNSLPVAGLTPTLTALGATAIIIGASFCNELLDREPVAENWAP
jgi:hypothetical protein